MNNLISEEVFRIDYNKFFFKGNIIWLCVRSIYFFGKIGDLVIVIYLCMYYIDNKVN